jgi:GGDEF domain-containing protein
MAKRYFMERGDVLMSVHLVLAAEWERKPPTAAPSLRRAVSAVVPERRRDPLAPRPRAAPRAPTLPDRTAPTLLIDPATGAPNLDALRRDVRLAGGRAGLAGDGSVLVALEIGELSEVRATLGLEAANSVLKALIELAAFSLRGRDRVYRVGFDQLVFLMTNTFEEGAVVALERYAEESERVLSARGLPPVELARRRLEQAMFAEAV